ncbi:hypothetical protein BofuT4_P067110.1 [Botrytis cinerea T4]|uniref:Uncharacterized protein n=1 Tax=Botryotinia fuckeliana (strain T4) TaxID=999810 RepID=G2XRD5_BOTF4|nr:hypothetical protein BofuT4_P067110.1 [Botrytis cinerea T4]
MRKLRLSLWQEASTGKRRKQLGTFKNTNDQVLTAISGNSRHRESLIDAPFSARCFGTRPAPNLQGLNHVLDLTTASLPSPPFPLRISRLNCSPMPRPSEDTQIMRLLARAIKSSADIALPPKKLTGSEFWAAVVQAPADISTPSENHPGRESATSIQNPTNPIPPQTRARKDFWAVCSN